eukprot:1157901-Pelagomonas_calceolata.AAC.10
MGLRSVGSVGWDRALWTGSQLCQCHCTITGSKPKGNTMQRHNKQQHSLWSSIFTSVEPTCSNVVRAKQLNGVCCMTEAVNLGLHCTSIHEHICRFSACQVYAKRTYCQHCIGMPNAGGEIHETLEGKAIIITTFRSQQLPGTPLSWVAHLVARRTCVQSSLPPHLHSTDAMDVGGCTHASDEHSCQPESTAHDHKRTPWHPNAHQFHACIIVV